MDESSVALCWAGRGVVVGEWAEEFALFGGFPAELDALGGLAVEGLGDSGGGALLAQAEDFDREVAGLVADLQHVAEPDLAGGLAACLVGRDTTHVAGLGGLFASLEEAGGPEPLVDTDADHVIVTDDEDLVSRVNQITANKGARLVFDPIGGKGLEALADITAASGTIFEYGALATEPTPYPLFTALRKHLTIKGYTVFEVITNPAEFPKAKQYVFDRLASGDFKPRIDKVFPLDQIVEAHRYMQTNAQIGKIVVTV